MHRPDTSRLLLDQLLNLTFVFEPVKFTRWAFVLCRLQQNPFFFVFEHWFKKREMNPFNTWLLGAMWKCLIASLSHIKWLCNGCGLLYAVFWHVIDGKQHLGTHLKFQRGCCSRGCKSEHSSLFLHTNTLLLIEMSRVEALKRTCRQKGEAID